MNYYNNCNDPCHKSCMDPCHHHHHHHHHCDYNYNMGEEINHHLGSYIYNALMKVVLPAGHAGLRDSLYQALTSGLPAGHPSIIDIIKTKL